MNQNWERNILPMLRTMRRASPCNRTSPLPQHCPCCLTKLAWGWSEEELFAPYVPGVIHLMRIPRMDQSVCCPECEGRILN